MTLSERTLKTWRKEALEDIEILKDSPDKRRVKIRERILKMTQELLDIHLLKK